MSFADRREAIGTSANWLHTGPQRYGFALITVAVATLSRYALGKLLGPSLPFLPFYPAIWLVAWMAGLWPGVFAVVLSAASVGYLFLGPANPSALGLPNDANGLMLFSVVGVAISVVADVYRGRTERLRDIIASAMDAVITVDEHQRIVLFNAAAEKMFRCPQAEALGQPLERFIPQRFRSAHSVHVREFGESGRTNRAKGTLDSLWGVRADGEEFQIEASISQIKIGHTKLFTAIIRDITERKLAEEALYKSEQRFSKAFRRSPLAITISTEGEGRYLDVNDAFLDLMGHKRKDVIGRTAAELAFWSDPFDRVEMLRQLKEGDLVAKHNTRYRTANGETREAEVWAELIELDGQACVLAITRDVTEIRQLEAQVRQAQKMEAVGQLAGGVAHDFNNLLGVIRGYADLALELVAPDDQLNRHLLQIARASQRAALLTQQLLAFSRKQVAFTKILDLNDVVRNATGMFLRLVGEDVSVEFQPTNPLGSVKADPAQIEQVLMNLVLNARDAMPTGGRIVIETAEAELDEHYASEHPGAHAGQHIVLTVSDTGCGMDESIKSQIFEPFFTTKRIGHGTGLGLSTVYGIVKQSGGYTLVYSEPGKGTTFKIYFPRVYERAEKLVLSHEEAEPPRGSGTILVVEDDETLRELTVKLLEDGGYRVVDARDAEGALRIMAASEPEIDLLLTDVIMPGTSGPELVRLAKEGHPKLRSLFVSGYSGHLVGKQGVLLQESSFLEKPFTKRALLTKVYATLHASP